MRDAVALLHRSTEVPKKTSSTDEQIKEPLHQARSLVRRLLDDAVICPDNLFDGPTLRKTA